MDTIPREILRYLLTENITYVEDISSICSTCKEWKEFRDLEWKIVDDEVLIIDLKFLTKFPNITMIEGPYLLIKYRYSSTLAMRNDRSLISRRKHISDLFKACSPVNPIGKLKYVKLITVHSGGYVHDLNEIFSSCNHLEIYNISSHNGSSSSMIEHVRKELVTNFSIHEGGNNLILRRKDGEEGTEIYCHHQVSRTPGGLLNLLVGKAHSNVPTVISSVSLQTLYDITTNLDVDFARPHFPKGSIEGIEPSTIYYKPYDSSTDAPEDRPREDEYIHMLCEVILDMKKNNCLRNFKRFVHKGETLPLTESSVKYCRNAPEEVVGRLIYYADITKVERLDLLLDTRDAIKYESKGLKLKKYYLLHPDSIAPDLVPPNEDGDPSKDHCKNWIQMKKREGVEIISYKIMIGHANVQRDSSRSSH